MKQRNSKIGSQQCWILNVKPIMRTEQLLSIRPQLDLLTPPEQSPIERFQNNTLRPILKLQHPITLRMLTDDKNFSKQLFQFQTKEQLHQGINAFVNSNKPFRSQIIGCILGMMTEEEHQIYRMNYSEYNKRMVTMQIQRYVDTMKL